MVLEERTPNVDAALARADDAASELVKEKNNQKNKTPPKKRSSKNPANSTTTSPSNNNKKAQPKGPTAADLSTINLPGEEDETVPIYLTAADVRKQIKQYLSHSKTAKTAFARELNELMPQTKVEVRHMDRFLKASGPKGAGHNPVFYAGYVFFEKKRIRDGKKMTAKRDEMERIWEASGGFPGSRRGLCSVRRGIGRGWIRMGGRGSGVRRLGRV